MDKVTALSERLEEVRSLVPIQLTPEELTIDRLQAENRELKIYMYTLCGLLVFIFLAARR